jgi:hypothetical protein
VEREPEQPDPNIPAIDRFKAAAEKLIAALHPYQDRAQALARQLSDLEAGVITRSGWEAVNNELQSFRAAYNAEIAQGIGKEVEAAYAALPASIKPDYTPQYQGLVRLTNIVRDFVLYLKQRIADDEALIGT